MGSNVSVVLRKRRRTALRRWLRSKPTLRESDIVQFILLLAAALLVAVVVLANPESVPAVAFAPIIVVAGLFLTVPRLIAVYTPIAAVILVLAVLFPRSDDDFFLTPISLVLVMIFMYLVGRSRSRLGTQGFHGDNLLVDLRDRIQRNGALPELPEGWRAESALHSANGDAFSGDFMVTSLSPDKKRLEVAVVDVSGKGRGAGARSLLLSGALSGILGSVGAFSFLSAANSFLMRQRWGEGFATAAHLDLDLDTGSYSIGLAGHPAPAHYHAGTATWEMVGTQGPLLGVMDRVFFPRASGRLQSGDALLFYTDGVIESRQYDLDDGVDRMLGVASQVMVNGGVGLADAVCRSARSGHMDDRAAFSIQLV